MDSSKNSRHWRGSPPKIHQNIPMSCPIVADSRTLRVRSPPKIGLLTLDLFEFSMNFRSNDAAHQNVLMEFGREFSAVPTVH